MIKRYGILTFLLACILGCTGIKEEEEAVTLTTVIGLDSDPVTRALTADGTKTFAPGDRVAFIYSTSLMGIAYYAVSEPLMAGNIFDGGKKARISVTLLMPKPGGDLTVVYPASMVTGSIGRYELDYGALHDQDGTLASLAGALDLAVYSGNLTSTSTLPDAVTLSNQLAIAEFTVLDGEGEDITSTITKFAVDDGTNGYSVSRTAAEGPIYLAMQAVDADKTLVMTANSGETYYMKSVTGKTLEAGKMYPVEVTMPVDGTGLSEPLTFEAAAPGALVGYHKSSVYYNDECNVQYSLNDGPWTDYDNACGGISLEKAGDKISFRGDNAYYGQYQSGYVYSYFYSDYQDCYIYGNVMSLVNSTGFAVEDAITESYAFLRIFADEPHFLNHESKDLLLPATHLYAFCYDSMFKGSTGLTRAPSLPAEDLGQYCYQEMFMGCTGLTYVPDLPARTLQNRCYRGMFYGCTSLATAPSMAAETLALECCMSMYQGCTSLTTPPQLPVTTLANQCYSQMFMGCTSLQTAPTLPAPTLMSGCYHDLFMDCTHLNRVVCLATNISASECTGGWLSGVSSTGTFVKQDGVEWPAGSAGIPEGWTVETNVAATE